MSGETGTLRLLTANLLNGGAPPAALAGLLEAERVDVACLQELAPAQAEAVAGVLPHGKLEPSSGPHDHDGMGIALRHAGDVERLLLRRRDARRAELQPGEWPGLRAPLEILNVHVQAPHAAPPWQAFPARRQQVAGLLAHLRRRRAPHRVLAGDLNATPWWPAYRALAGELEDAAWIHAVQRGQRPGRTWGPRPGGASLLRIDHVLCDGLDVLDVRVLELPGTDHRPLLVEFALPLLPA